VVIAVVRLLDVLDNQLGDGLEAVLTAHHARRLRRLGWGDVLPATDDEGFTPRRDRRTGNRAAVLIDGERALASMAAAIQAVRRHVHIAGWHSSPEFRLTREPGAPTLRDLLATEKVGVRIALRE